MTSTSRGAFWATAGNWIQQGFSLFTLLVVARLLDPSSFGLLATALLFVLLTQRLLLESVGYAVVQRKEPNQAYLSAAFWLATSGGLMLSVCLYLTSGALGILFAEPALVPVLSTLAVIPFVDGLCTVHAALFKREMRFKALAMRTLGVNLLGGLVGLTMAFKGAGVWALVAQQLIQTMGSCFVLWRAHGWRPTFSAPRKETIELVRFGAPMTINAVVFVLSNRLDVMALAAFSGAGATGIYSIAKRLARSVTDLLVSGVVTASMTTLSKQADDISARSATFTRQLQFLAWLAFPAFGCLAIVAPTLIPSLLGTKWISTAPTLQILCLYGVFQVPILMGNTLLVAMQNTRAVMFLNVFSLIALGMLLYLGHAATPKEVAIAFVLQAAMGLCMLTVLLCTKADVDFVKFATAVTLPIAGVAVAGIGPILIAPEVHDSGALHQLFVPFMQIAMFGVVYILLSLLFQKNEMNTLLTKILKRSSI